MDALLLHRLLDSFLFVPWTSRRHTHHPVDYSAAFWMLFQGKDASPHGPVSCLDCGADKAEPGAEGEIQDR